MKVILSYLCDRVHHDRERSLSITIQNPKLLSKITEQLAGRNPRHRHLSAVHVWTSSVTIENAFVNFVSTTAPRTLNTLAVEMVSLECYGMWNAKKVYVEIFFGFRNISHCKQGEIEVVCSVPVLHYTVHNFLMC